MQFGHVFEGKKILKYHIFQHKRSCSDTYAIEEQQPINHRLWKFRLWQNGNQQTYNFFLV